MTALDWEEIERRGFPGYRVTRFLGEWGQQALFSVVDESSGSEEFAIGVQETDAGSDILPNRFREAAFLSHPNLARIFEVETFQHNGRSFFHYVTEPLHESLADAELAGRPHSEILRSVAPPLLAALQYLHEQNLICCGLGPRSVWRSGSTWKLADFGELRLAGKYTSSETRRLMIRKDISAPPEAYEGVVSPAWDAWSLGATLLEVISHSAGAGNSELRTGRLEALSPESNESIKDLLDPDMGQRLTLAGFERRLALLSSRPKTPDPDRAAPPWLSDQRATYIGPSTFSSSAEHQSTEHRSTEHQPTDGKAAHRVIPPEPAHDRAAWRRMPSWLLPSLLAAAGALVLAISTLSGGADKQMTGRASQEAREARQQSAAPQVPVPPPSGATDLKGGSAGIESSQRPTPFRPPSGSPEAAVSATLTRWVDSIRTRNLDQQLDCYAPVVDRYFGRKHLSREDLRAEKEKVFATIGAVKEFSLINPQFNFVAPGRVVVVADKSWKFPARHFSGVSREEITLRDIGGEWKISGERDLRREREPVAAQQVRGRHTAFPAPVTSDPETILAGAR